MFRISPSVVSRSRRFSLLEPLEGRRLLTSSFNEATGVLTVTGTSGDDPFIIHRAVSGGFDLLHVFYDTISEFSVEYDEVTRIDISLLGGDDVMDIQTNAAGQTVNKPTSILGGDDNDTLIGNVGADTFLGGNGDDSIIGSTGDDWMEGGAGADYLEGSGGNNRLIGNADADTFVGGSNIDIADFSDKSATLTITIDDNADDGESNEGDWVALGIERVIGGSGNDNISGTGGDNVLYGRGGDDSLFGQGGNDVLYGEGGADLLDGGSNNDILDAGSGLDVLLGQSGNDYFYTIDGSIDAITGGSGSDSADKDHIDVLIDGLP